MIEGRLPALDGLLPQGLQARDGGQHRNRMAFTKPGDVTITFRRRGQRSLWLLRHQHLEGKACERARRHNQKPLALDHVLDLPEQRLIKLMGLIKIEGQGILRKSGTALSPRSAAHRLRRLGVDHSSASKPQRRLETARASDSVPVGEATTR